MREGLTEIDRKKDNRHELSIVTGEQHNSKEKIGIGRKKIKKAVQKDGGRNEMLRDPAFKLILAVSTAYLSVKPGQMLVATAEKNVSPQDSVIRMTAHFLFSKEYHTFLHQK